MGTSSDPTRRGPDAGEDSPPDGPAASGARPPAAEARPTGRRRTPLAGATIAAVLALAGAAVLSPRMGALALALIAVTLLVSILQLPEVHLPAGVGLFFVIALVGTVPSVLASIQPATSLRALAELSLGLLALAVGTSLGAYRATPALVRVLVLLSVAVSLSGLVDFTLQHEDALAGRVLREPLGWHTLMAGWFLLTWPIAFLLFREARGDRQQLLWGTSLALILGALFLTFSRLALFITAAQGIALLWSGQETRSLGERRRFAAILALALVLSGGGLLASRVGRLRLFGPTAVASLVESRQERADLWSRALQAITVRPWFGTGVGTVADALVLAQSTPWVHARYAHNTVLELFTTTGLFGGTLWSAVFLVLFSRLWRAYRRHRPRDTARPLLLTFLLAALAGSFLQTLGDIGWSSLPIWLLGWLAAGLALSEAPLTRLAPRVVAGLTVLVLGGVLLQEQTVRIITRRLEAGDTDRATELLSRPWVRLFLDPTIDLLAARTAAQRGDHETASRAYDRAVERMPDLPAPRIERADFWFQTGRRRDALREYDGVLARTPFATPTFHLRAIRAARALGDEDRARTLARTALDIYFPETDTLYHHAHTLEQTGQVTAYRDLLLLAFELTGDTQYTGRLDRLRQRVAWVFAVREAYE